MSFLSDYDQRTAWKYEPIRGIFPAAANLANKVNPDGSYAPFHGSTVVFRPGRRCAQIIQLIQEALDSKLGGTDMLASRLDASTIHMTLHDLISPEMCASNAASAYNREVADSIDRAAGIVEAIRKDCTGKRIAMVSDRIVNMVSKSLVLLLRPQTERDAELLAEMYARFDAVQKLPYLLTPHITLAYFKPGVIDGDALSTAVDFAQIDPQSAPVFEFHSEGLTVQRFLDMRTYLDVPVRICFCCDGGLNRSVMAANILNHLAKERNLPAIGEARAAFANTRGRPVPEPVWETLQSHGILCDRENSSTRYLEDGEESWFSDFAAISDGAQYRLSLLRLPVERVQRMSRIFYGVMDPEYGEITYEEAFRELYARAERALDLLAEGKRGGNRTERPTCDA